MSHIRVGLVHDVKKPLRNHREISREGGQNVDGMKGVGREYLYRKG